MKIFVRVEPASLTDHITSSQVSSSMRGMLDEKGPKKHQGIKGNPVHPPL